MKPRPASHIDCLICALTVSRCSRANTEAVTKRRCPPEPLLRQVQHPTEPLLRQVQYPTEPLLSARQDCGRRLAHRCPQGPRKALRGGISKVNFRETLSIFGDKCPQNGSKTAPTAPRPHLGYPHIRPFVGPASPRSRCRGTPDACASLIGESGRSGADRKCRAR